MKTYPVGSPEACTCPGNDAARNSVDRRSLQARSKRWNKCCTYALGQDQLEPVHSSRSFPEGRSRIFASLQVHLERGSSEYAGRMAVVLQMPSEQRIECCTYAPEPVHVSRPIFFNNFGNSLVTFLSSIRTIIVFFPLNRFLQSGTAARNDHDHACSLELRWTEQARRTVTALQVP